MAPPSSGFESVHHYLVWQWLHIQNPKSMLAYSVYIHQVVPHYIPSHIHTPVFRWQLPHNPSTRWASMYVCCITTSLLGIDVDFATQVATPTRPNSHVMWTTWLPFGLFCRTSATAEQTTGPIGNIYQLTKYEQYVIQFNAQFCTHSVYLHAIANTLSRPPSRYYRLKRCNIFYT